MRRNAGVILIGSRTTVPKAAATYSDLEALPDNMVGQIVFGVLYSHSRPAPKHAQAATTLGEELGPPFKRGRGGPGGWLLLDEPEVHLGPHVVVPDLAGWRRERMPEMPIDKAYFELAPDWGSSTPTPGCSRSWRFSTTVVYRVLEVFGGEANVRAVPFDAIGLELGSLWAR
jgi:hypothetical protein